MMKTPGEEMRVDPIRPSDQPKDAADDAVASLDSRHLASILAFLSREIDESAAILRDLAARLSQEFCELADMEESNVIRRKLAVSAVALQNEDRIQQRLGDLRTALSVLESTLNAEQPARRCDIDDAIIGRLRLEEIRQAFAVSIGLAELFPGPAKPAEKPQLGHIDLF